MALRKKLPTYLFIFLYWMISINGLSLVSLMSLRALISYLGLDISTFGPLAEYWIAPQQLFESLTFSVFFSFLFIGINEIADHFKLDRYSFGRVILLKSLMYMAGIAASFLVVSGVISLFGLIDPTELDNFAFNREMLYAMIVVLIYMTFLLVLLNFILQTTKKVGSNNLISFLTGRYHKPVMEDRIFLFLDLTSSTTYAEKLGSIKFSELIKDCFDDINFLVDRFDAEIYQYVGDEIVLTWEKEKGLHSNNFLEIFFAFQQSIASRADYYEGKYGILPEFKAGANGGPITVAEVGNIRRDIAFYGDVINTAARLQSICNQYQEKLLISSELYSQIDALNGYQSSSLGAVQLKGKLREIEVIAIKNA